jgi:hypothetical protein
MSTYTHRLYQIQDDRTVVLGYEPVESDIRFGAHYRLWPSDRGNPFYFEPGTGIVANPSASPLFYLTGTVLASGT